MNHSQFESLLHRLAEAWAAPDPVAGAALFAEDAVYMEPPDSQLFVGREQLEAYFSPLTAGTYLDFHHISFDETSQRGAVEFSFGVRGTGRADHGVAVVDVHDGLIAGWREYQRPGPESFAEFSSALGKSWEWHIGNYP